MKRQIAQKLLFCILSGLFWSGLFGCGSSTQTPVGVGSLHQNLEAKKIEENYQTSLGVAQSLIRGSGGYSYKVGSLLPLSYCLISTTLTVQNHKIIRREFENTTSCGVGHYPSYVEEIDSIGSHSYGAELRTLEEMYAQCKDEVLSSLQDPKYKVRFETGQDGLLKKCIKEPIAQPQGACWIGSNISISDVSWF